MVQQFTKGAGIPLSAHFRSNEFDCKCRRPSCTYTLVDSDLISGLEVLREKFGAIIILSGFRCSAHNREVGGKPGSFHMLGKAADVASTVVSAQKLSAYAETVPVFRNGGLGRYAGFTHVDARGYRARWSG